MEEILADLSEASRLVEEASAKLPVTPEGADPYDPAYWSLRGAMKDIAAAVNVIKTHQGSEYYWNGFTR